MDKVNNFNDLIAFYKGKSVLISGHNGFKGSWLSQILLLFGSKITGISLKPKKNSLFEKLKISNEVDDNYCNIENINSLRKVFKKSKPEIVFHLAAQPLVKLSYLKPLKTHRTNYLGTANILQVISETSSVRSVVFVTTDKVYRNEEKGNPFKEDDPLGGFDPYSASKAASEILIESWRKSFFNSSKVGIASSRSGNVIGGGDYAKDRILPDLFKAKDLNITLTLRNPQSTRPWQHVLEPLSGYLKLAMKLFDSPSKYSSSYNFGPLSKDNLKVIDLVNKASSIINYPTSKILIKKSSQYESNLLSLSIDKSKKDLDWFPKYSSIEAVELTSIWYINQDSNEIKSLTINQIKDYFNF
jgi:CDP-glucose 4,6-dehydratase